jgi:CheY-like chemotaxis protein
MAEKPATILVIDDDENVRGALDRALGKSGYQVRTAVDGREALELMNSGPVPDLILLDLMMPVMTGFEVLTALRVNEAWAKIPVIVLSGTPGHPSDQLGVAASLPKPFDLGLLRAAVEQALKKTGTR